MASSKTPAHAPALEFTSDRLRLLAPFITPEVVALARERIRESENFFTRRELRVSADRLTVKFALLLAYEMNPLEDFSDEEEALMRGIHATTLRTRKTAREIRPL